MRWEMKWDGAVWYCLDWDGWDWLNDNDTSIRCHGLVYTFRDVLCLGVRDEGVRF